MITNSLHAGRTAVGLTSGLWLASFQLLWMEETDRILPIFGLFSNKARKNFSQTKAAASSKGKEMHLLNQRLQIDSVLLRPYRYLSSCQRENCKGPFSPQLSQYDHLAFLSHQNSVNYVLKH